MMVLVIVLAAIALIVWGANCGDTTAELAFPVGIIVGAGLVFDVVIIGVAMIIVVIGLLGYIWWTLGQFNEHDN